VRTEQIASLFGIPDLADRLAAVEERVRSVLVAGGPELGDPSWRVARAGGKRFRPLFTIACAEIGSVFDDAVIDGAAAIELVQVGSLIHDDLFDAAMTRRGALTINAVEGSGHALLAGNWVLAAASELAINVSAPAASLVAETVARLCMGQLEEFEMLFDLDRPLESHLNSIRGKTAALFEAACRMGTICADLEPVLSEATARFGDAFGMSFQLVDDLLDIVGDPLKLGKPVGVDLLAGIYTYPVLVALNGSNGDRLRRALGTGEGTNIDETLRAVVESEGMGAAHLLIDTYIEVARLAAAELPESAVRTGMQEFPSEYSTWALEELTIST
jgi:geranylgeranyl pyrophosphate synthase